jgi:hypothetical protein
MGVFNPTRRNRNIGTAKSGHGQDNRMVIPRVAHGENDFWERIEKAGLVSRTICGKPVKFFVQPTLRDCVHACTVDDVVLMLSLLPVGDWDGIEAILLRQPRRKEHTLAPVWGRLAYAAQLVNERGDEVHFGPVIVIEAVNPSRPTKFGKSLSPQDIAELERLKSEGHRVLPGGRNHAVVSTLESCRATQLYRTLPHEIGHWLDFLEKVERPATIAENREKVEGYDGLLQRFHLRPLREKEQYAHAYAQRVAQLLSKNRKIPFERQLCSSQIEIDGLRRDDFEIF